MFLVEKWKDLRYSTGAHMTIWQTMSAGLLVRSVTDFFCSLRSDPQAQPGEGPGTSQCCLGVRQNLYAAKRRSPFVVW